MVATIQCNVVSAERSLFSGLVTSIQIKGTLGELGILPGHTPLLTGVEPCAMLLQLPDDTSEVIFVSGGFLEVQPNEVTVLANIADEASELSEELVKKAQADALEILENREEHDFNYAQASRLLSESTARLHSIEQLRKIRHKS